MRDGGDLAPRRGKNDESAATPEALPVLDETGNGTRRDRTEATGTRKRGNGGRPRQQRVTDDIDALLAVIPPRLIGPLSEVADRSSLLEIVLDLGRLPESRYPGREIVLSEQEVSDDDLAYVVERIGEFGDDNRAGIERTLHRISAIRNRKGRIVGLTCRIGRAVYGTIAIIRDIIESGKSVLLLGRPGVGKTTMLREVARVLADDLKKRVIIVDTSNEIAGDGDVPHPAIGHARRMQVPRTNLQHAVMIEAVENHMPEVIVIDEIGTEAEAQAARTIAERGVQLVGTAHGTALENIMLNPTLCDLVGGIQSVTLSDEEARRRGTQKSILERKAPPTFDMVVEIQSWEQVAVHLDVADTVDSILRGRPIVPQIRFLDEAGNVKAEEAVRPPVPLTAAAAGRGMAELLAEEERFAAMPVRATTTRAPLRSLRIYPYGASMNRLEQAVRELRVPVQITKSLDEADAVLTVKASYRKKPPQIRDAEDSGLPVYVLRSNTVIQMEQALASIYDLDVQQDPVQEAIAETEEAVNQVVAKSEDEIELTPQNSYIRKLQHEIAERYHVKSTSHGREPQRRVRISRG